MLLCVCVYVWVSLGVHVRVHQLISINWQLIDGTDQLLKLQFLIQHSIIEIAISIIDQLLQLIENQ
jgi:hypothetical protein